MSYGFSVHVRKCQLPSARELAEILQRAGGRVAIATLDEIATLRGVVPVLLDGEPTSFELYTSEITQVRRDSYLRRLERAGQSGDELLEILMACDLDVGFVCKAAEPREIAAARIVAHALPAAANGWFCDPQTAETIRYAVGASGG